MDALPRTVAPLLCIALPGAARVRRCHTARSGRVARGARGARAAVGDRARGGAWRSRWRCWRACRRGACASCWGWSRCWPSPRSGPSTSWCCRAPRRSRASRSPGRARCSRPPRPCSRARPAAGPRTWSPAGRRYPAHGARSS
jgi:hypothetical protein